MKAFCFSLAILCVVQTVLAIPRPDFGINGDVSSSSSVVMAANQLGTEFAKPGAKVITLSSGYGLLTTLKTKLTEIGDAIALTGGELATELSALAVDDDGPIADVFGEVNTKIVALETYITNPVTNIEDISALVGDDIELQFIDAFAAMASTIDSLQTALAKLESDIEAAKSAAGNAAVVSSSTIRKNVPSKSVTDVILWIRTLRANIPVITYIINSSLDNIILADEFIVEIELEATTAVGDYNTALAGFQTDLSTEKGLIVLAINDNRGDDVTVLTADIEADLTASAGYSSSGLSDALSAINVLITTDLDTAVDSIQSWFTSYSVYVPNLITDLDAELGDSLCEPIRAVSEALVANGPYSDFCFSKYSPRVYALLALTINAFDTCFQREVARLSRLESIVGRIVAQIVFNVEDLVDNLSVCLALDEADATDCFSTITPYYEVLGEYIELHESTFVDLVDRETFASYNRLGSCIATSLYVTIAQGLEISVDVGECAGPLV